MELDPSTLSQLKAFTARGMEADDLQEVAVALGKVVQQIQVRRGVDRNEALRTLAEALGEAGSDEFVRILRLPGESGTIDD